MSLPTFRLPINARAFYTVQLYAGCHYCDAPPGVLIQKITKDSVCWDELKDAPEINLAKVDDYTEALISCGPDSSEFRKEAVHQMNGTEVEGGKIDEALADILAEDLWKEVVLRRPKLIEYKRA
jgi:hypothetical protein